LGPRLAGVPNAHFFFGAAVGTFCVPTAGSGFAVTARVVGRVSASLSSGLIAKL
jgi:hypothetical protein